MNHVPVAEDKLPKAIGLISGTTVIGALYTFVFVLYCLSARLSYRQLRNPDGKLKRQTVFTLTLASAMMICATLDITSASILKRIIYVDYGSLPGGSLGLPASLHATTALRVEIFVRIIEIFLISGVLVWRVSVLWSGNPFVKPVTLLLYVAQAGIVITDAVMQWQISGQIISSSGIPRVSLITFITSTAFVTANLMFMTSMLVIRLLSVRWQHIEVMGKSDTADQYLSIAAILIESYVLETAWNIAFCISCALRYAPIDNFFGPTVIQIDILTNLLVIYRVVSGRAWDRQTRDRISTLRWNRNAQSGATTGTVNP